VRATDRQLLPVTAKANSGIDLLGYRMTEKLYISLKMNRGFDFTNDFEMRELGKLSRHEDEP